MVDGHHFYEKSPPWIRSDGIKISFLTNLYWHRKKAFAKEKI